MMSPARGAPVGACGAPGEVIGAGAIACRSPASAKRNCSRFHPSASQRSSHSSCPIEALRSDFAVMRRRQVVAPAREVEAARDVLQVRERLLCEAGDGNRLLVLRPVLPLAIQRDRADLASLVRALLEAAQFLPFFPAPFGGADTRPVGVPENALRVLRDRQIAL